MARARPQLSAAEAEIARIRRSYKGVLVALTSLTVRPDTPVADVGTIDDLMTLARAYDLKVFEQTAAEGTSFLLWDNGLIVRYRVGEPAGLALTPSPAGHRRADAPPTRPTWAKDAPSDDGSEG